MLFYIKSRNLELKFQYYNLGYLLENGLTFWVGLINWVIINNLGFKFPVQDDERRRWYLLLDCEPPPGDGYHVCEVKVQGLILQLSDK